MKYRIDGIATFSVTTVVEADSEQEAREIAGQREMASMAFNALYPGEDEAWHTELDGEPIIKEVTEADE